MHYIVNMILCHFLFCLVKSQKKMNKIHLLQQDLYTYIYFTYIIYRVFIKYCVFFSEDFKIFRTLAFLCFPSVSVCVHTPGR